MNYYLRDDEGLRDEKQITKLTERVGIFHMPRCLYLDHWSSFSKSGNNFLNKLLTAKPS